MSDPTPEQLRELADSLQTVNAHQGLTHEQSWDIEQAARHLRTYADAAKLLVDNLALEEKLHAHAEALKQAKEALEMTLTPFETTSIQQVFYERRAHALTTINDLLK